MESNAYRSYDNDFMSAKEYKKCLIDKVKHSLSVNNLYVLKDRELFRANVGIKKFIKELEKSLECSIVYYYITIYGEYHIKIKEV